MERHRYKHIISRTMRPSIENTKKRKRYYLVQWVDPQPPHDIIHDPGVPRNYFKDAVTRELYDTNLDLTYHRTRKMLRVDKLPVILRNPK